MKASRSVLLSAALLAAGLLTGCGLSTPGAAAVVDGESIGVAQLQQAYADLLTLPLQGELSQAQVLALMIGSDAVLDEASDRGLAVSESDVVSQVQAVLETDEEEPVGPEAVRVLQTVLALSRIGSELPPEQASEAQMEITDELLVAEVEVNPRYGTFDAQGIAVQPIDNPWLSGDEATPAPTS